jgi:hypothetical protein
MKKPTKSEVPHAGVLDAARAALARARSAPHKIDPKVLLRFEKKLLITEGAIAPVTEVTTTDGLVAVLARAEQTAGTRARTPEQVRALETLRSELLRREQESKKGGAKAKELLGTLAADTARLDALATPKPPAKAKARAKDDGKRAKAAEAPKKKKAAR